MKILLTSGIYPPDIGGPASYVPTLAKAFREKGHQTTIVSLRPLVRGEVHQEGNAILVKRGFLPLRVVKTVIKIFLEALTANRIFSNGLYLETAIAARITRTSSVAKIVGDPLWERKRNNGKTSHSITDFQTSHLTLLDRCNRSIHLWSFNSFNVLTCPSEELAAIIRGWGVKPQVIVIPNGVEIPTIEPTEKRFDLVYVGRLVKWKNVDLVIKLSSELRLSAAIIGSGPELPNLKNLAISLNANCEFLGDQPKNSIDQVLNESRIFILLSQYEGLSFALLEAMAAGIVPIVSDATGNLDVVTNEYNAVVAPLSDLQTLPNRVKELLNDKSKMQNLGNNALTTVRNRYFAPDRISDMMELTLGAQ
jgi:glycosyltransferase involved in cell wall biosynthesis